MFVEVSEALNRTIPIVSKLYLAPETEAEC
jgi:hypothetical protein